MAISHRNHHGPVPHALRKLLSSALATTLLACAGGPPGDDETPATIHFTDIAVTAGLTRVHTGGGPDKEYIVEAKGGGGALLDVEGDGDLDIYWVNGATLDDPAGAGNALYRNDGAARFTDVAAAAGVAGRGWGMGAVSADVDADGDPDLYVTCLGRDLLYRNLTRRDTVAFRDATAEAAVDRPGWSTGAAFGDYDLDGDLDLYVAGYARFDTTRVRPLSGHWRGQRVFAGPVGLPAQPDALLRNNGDRFTDVSAAAGVGAVTPAYGLGVLFVDVDDDGDLDLFVANDSQPNFLFRNRGGRFVEAASEAGVAYERGGSTQASMGVAWGDADGDLRPDLFVTSFEYDTNTLYHNAGDGRFTDVSAVSSLAAPSFPWVGFGAAFADLDDDGDLDLFVANGHVYPQLERAGGAPYGQPDHVYRNRGDGTFVRLGLEAGLEGHPGVSRTALAGDLDGDGDLDVFVHHLNARPALWRNDGTAGNWLGVRLVGTCGNRDGIGARLDLITGGRTQVRHAVRGSSFLGSQDPRLHFGLGRRVTADSLVVRWPSGQRQVIATPPANCYLTVVEPSEGDCAPSP